MRENRGRAVGLLSGGLDSTLAAKLLLDQGIEVFAINFTSPFCTCTPKSAGCAAAITAVRELGGIKLKRVALRDEYLEMVQNPKNGYGSGVNPCIDCRIMKIKKAGEYMKQIGASFMFTGEVLGQRPMSQHKRAISIIDRESGFEGYLLRPLSAAHFEPTIPEQEGLVDRSKFLGIRGRSRKEQISLADKMGIKDYPCPAGGCLLTDKNFAERIRDYFTFVERPSIKDIALLKVGRHFRLDSGDKVVVARDEQEGQMLEKLCGEEDHLLAPLDFSGPTVICQGSTIEAGVEKLLQYTNRVVPEAASISHLHRGESKVVILDDILESSAHARRFEVN